MEYLFFIATDPEAEPYDPKFDNIQEWFTALESRGAHLRGTRIRPPAEAKLVRVRDGKLVVTDEPFTKSKEWIAGFDLIEAADLDEAIQIAAQHPMARFGRIEIRPVWPFEA